MTRKTSTGHVVSVSGAAWLGEHPAGIGGQAADLAWEGWKTELRDEHGRWARGQHLDTGTSPFSPGTRHLYSVLAPVNQAIAAGHAEDASSTQAVTRVVTLASGEKVIDKQGEMPEDLDREELASYVAHAIGAPAPAVYRAAPDRILQEYVHGKTAVRYFSDVMDAAYNRKIAEGGSAMDAIQAEHVAEDKARDAVFATPEARKIAELDYLTSNEDRNETNWMIDGRGRPVAIDHGVVGFDGMPSDSSFVQQHDPLRQRRKFVRGYDQYEPTTDPAEIRDRASRGWELADQLRPLQAQFTRLGHGDWFDTMLEDTVGQLINPGNPRAAYWQILKHWQDKYGDPEPWLAKPRGA